MDRNMILNSNGKQLHEFLLAKAYPGKKLFGFTEPGSAEIVTKAPKDMQLASKGIQVVFDRSEKKFTKDGQIIPKNIAGKDLYTKNVTMTGITSNNLDYFLDDTSIALGKVTSILSASGDEKSLSNYKNLVNKMWGKRFNFDTMIFPALEGNWNVRILANTNKTHQGFNTKSPSVSASFVDTKYYSESWKASIPDLAINFAAVILASKAWAYLQMEFSKSLALSINTVYLTIPENSYDRMPKDSFSLPNFKKYKESTKTTFTRIVGEISDISYMHALDRVHYNDDLIAKEVFEKPELRLTPSESLIRKTIKEKIEKSLALRVKKKKIQILPDNESMEDTLETPSLIALNPPSKDYILETFANYENVDFETGLCEVLQSGCFSKNANNNSFATILYSPYNDLTKNKETMAALYDVIHYVLQMKHVFYIANRIRKNENKANFVLRKFSSMMNSNLTVAKDGHLVGWSNKLSTLCYDLYVRFRDLHNAHIKREYTATWASVVKLKDKKLNTREVHFKTATTTIFNKQKSFWINQYKIKALSCKNKFPRKRIYYQLIRKLFNIIDIDKLTNFTHFSPDDVKKEDFPLYSSAKNLWKHVGMTDDFPEPIDNDNIFDWLVIIDTYFLNELNDNYLIKFSEIYEYFCEKRRMFLMDLDRFYYFNVGDDQLYEKSCVAMLDEGLFDWKAIIDYIPNLKEDLKARKLKPAYLPNVSEIDTELVKTLREVATKFEKPEKEEPVIIEDEIEEKEEKYEKTYEKFDYYNTDKNPKMDFSFMTNEVPIDNKNNFVLTNENIQNYKFGEEILFSTTWTKEDLLATYESLAQANKRAKSKGYENFSEWYDCAENLDDLAMTENVFEFFDSKPPSDLEKNDKKYFDDNLE